MYFQSPLSKLGLINLADGIDMFANRKDVVLLVIGYDVPVIWKSLMLKGAATSIVANILR